MPKKNKCLLPPTDDAGRNPPFPHAIPLNIGNAFEGLGGNERESDGTWGEGAMKLHGLPAVFCFLFWRQKRKRRKLELKIYKVNGWGKVGIGL